MFLGESVSLTSDTYSPYRTHEESAICYYPSHCCNICENDWGCITVWLSGEEKLYYNLKTVLWALLTYDENNNDCE